MTTLFLLAVEPGEVLNTFCFADVVIRENVVHGPPIEDTYRNQGQDDVTGNFPFLPNGKLLQALLLLIHKLHQVCDLHIEHMANLVKTAEGEALL